ncbi:hypothetical protein KP509_23G049700 [Ceratopteris richardii]|uniref:Amino acid transporter transmembrane domain-containing protein n=1 Tax=Ceratopteris richardii TaxID=49495 RepID=A0A8T2S1G8_CERRI|nr:hypothetical protein KP509_23G049700 [Ceratopteris richardii]KAH7301951.1 hypothetical protein KP509_23G049700 [Ceratopteris richardii]
MARNSQQDAKFDFTQLESQCDIAQQDVEVPQASSLTRKYWPQSYERTMDCYSRSPPFVTGISFSWPPGEDSQDQSHGLSLQERGCTLTNDLKEPLVRNTSSEIRDNVVAIDESNNNGLRPAFQDHLQYKYSVSQQGQSSFFQAVMNGINALAGVGILSMPYAVSQGGWIGVSFLLIFAAVCCYTGLLLRRCLDLFPQAAGYPDVGQAAFGRLGRIIISCLLYVELFAVAVEFVIMEGDNLTQLLPLNELHFRVFRLSSEQSFVILSAAVMLPTVWLRDLSLLSYLSAGGVVACVTVVIVVAYIGISDVGFTNHGELLNVQGFPIAVGLYAFCYCGHALFPNIYASMRDKSKFSCVLVVCFLTCAVIYGGIAVIGFLMFGDAIRSQVTLNLPKGRPASKLAIITTLVNPFSKYALTVTPLAAAIEELLSVSLKSWRFWMWGIAIRTLIVMSTVLIALAVPFFAYLMALVGAFLSTTVAITVPCLCYMKLFSGRIPTWERSLLFLFIVIGLVACVAGTYSALLEIAKGLTTQPT